MNSLGLRKCVQGLVPAGLLAWGAWSGAQTAYPGPVENPSSAPTSLTPLGQSLCFSADDGIHGREVWIWDGTQSPACRLLSDLCPGPESSTPHNFFDAGGHLYVCAQNTPKEEPLFWLWQPDSDSFSRVVEMDTQRPAIHGDPDCVIDGELYFTLEASGNKCDLARVPVGTCTALRATDVSSVQVDMFCVLADASLLFGSRTGLWRKERASNHGIPLLENVGLHFMLPLGDGALVAPDHAAYGMEPWYTDGTREGTRLLLDIFPGRNSSSFGQLCAWRGRVFFNPDDGVHGSELWKTDGTSAGTVLVADIAPGAISSDPHYFSPAGDWLYFVASDIEHGQELWKTDGTTEGTMLVSDLHPGPLGNDFWSLKEFQGRLYFCANSVVAGEEIFLSDGTAEGTRMLVDLVPGIGDSGPNNLCPLGPYLFFTANDQVHGEELWLSDGTSEGTRLAADIALPRYNPSSSPRQLTALGRQVLFTVNDLDHGNELWISDGTETGTHLLRDIAAGPESSTPILLGALGDYIFFATDDRIHGWELWKTRGTAEDTVLVRDIAPGPRGVLISSLHVFNNQAYFFVSPGDAPQALWRSDGTEAGTGLVLAHPTGRPPGSLSGLFDLNQKLYLYCGSGGQLSLWWGDGTPSGMHHGIDLQSAEIDSDVSALLARARGSSDVAEVDMRLASVVRPPGDAAPGSTLRIGDTTFFVARMPETGAELWKTDGTCKGTCLVQDVFPGRPSSSPACMVNCGGNLYFIAEDLRLGRILWRSPPPFTGARAVNLNHDGFRLGELGPSQVKPAEWGLLVSCGSQVSPLDADPHLGMLFQEGDLNRYRFVFKFPPELYRAEGEIVACRDLVFFVHDDGTHGAELWVAETGQGAPLLPPSHLVRDIVSKGDLRPLAR